MRAAHAAAPPPGGLPTVISTFFMCELSHTLHPQLLQRSGSGDLEPKPQQSQGGCVELHGGTVGAVDQILHIGFCSPGDGLLCCVPSRSTFRWDLLSRCGTPGPLGFWPGAKPAAQTPSAFNEAAPAWLERKSDFDAFGFVWLL